jgi:hypothetical protein
MWVHIRVWGRCGVEVIVVVVVVGGSEGGRDVCHVANPWLKAIDNRYIFYGGSPLTLT